jgi:predicted Rossmann fold flavoprotein
MATSDNTFDVIVLGAGAAGCFAAIEAAKGGRSVLLIDHGKQVGGKIPISGGGRCNFTNTGADWSHYQSQNPRFAASALSRYTPQDFISLVNSHNIAWHEKHSGQLFCDGSAGQIVTLLEKELKKSGVETALNCRVESVEKTGSGFKVACSLGLKHSPNLVVATGGLSYPSLGATALGLMLARQFGHRIVETAAALDGFVFGPKEKEAYVGLQGIALPKAEVRAGAKRFKDALLFTHKGISGPAGLQASLYWRPGEAIQVDLWPDEDVEALLLEAKKRRPSDFAASVLAARWPKQLVQRFCDLGQVSGVPLARCSEAVLRALAGRASRWSFKPVSTVGYHKAEVTRGGVDTAELNQKTLQSRKVAGLYFVGEVVDITGELGGYNFQWAWASGWAAGTALAQGEA